MSKDYIALENGFRSNNGVLKTTQLNALGYYYRGIQDLIENGKISKIKNGYYSWVENVSDLAMRVAGLFPDGVIFMDSALYYYGYSDICPLEWHIAIDKNTSKVRFKLEYPFIKPYYVEPSVLEIGITEAEFKCCKMKIYDKDRLICDVIKYEAKIDQELYKTALIRYIEDNDKNINSLLEYSKIRKVDKKVKNVLGAWL